MFWFQQLAVDDIPCMGMEPAFVSPVPAVARPLGALRLPLVPVRLLGVPGLLPVLVLLKLVQGDNCNYSAETGRIERGSAERNIPTGEDQAGSQGRCEPKRPCAGRGSRTAAGIRGIN
jgi:hypothetical protein